MLLYCLSNQTCQCVKYRIQKLKEFIQPKPVAAYSVDERQRRKANSLHKLTKELEKG